MLGNLKKDLNGNFTQGNIVLETQKTHIFEVKIDLVGIDLNDLIVETRDAILISDKKSSQKVKNLVNHLKENKIPEGQSHTKVCRPWGHFCSRGPQVASKINPSKARRKIILADASS